MSDLKVGDVVRFHHEPTPRKITEVVEAKDDVMVELEGMAGQFSSHVVRRLSNCCKADMVAGGAQCETCGSNGE